MSAVAAPARAVLADPFRAARAMFEELPEYLDSPEVLQMSHSEVEQELEQRGRELMRSLYQAWLNRQSPGEAQQPVVDAEGNERTRRRIQERDLATVFGEVTVRRTGYGAEGQESLHPLDARLNLPEERYSYGLRRRAAEEAARGSFDEAVKAISSHTGTQVPKRQVEELVQRAAQDFDAFYQARQADPSKEPSESLLVMTADGKGVVMHREDLRPETRAAAAKDRATLRTRVTRAERGNRKRMATVAAVYTIAPYVRTPREVYLALAREPGESGPALPLPRPRPQKKRLWASLERETKEVLEAIYDEAESRDPERSKTWVALVDGNEHVLSWLEFLASEREARITVVIDLFHVLQYVWEAGRALEGPEDARIDAWVLERMRWILEGQAVHTAAGMRRSATRRGLSGKKRKSVDRCANYLLKYSAYLKYDEYLAAGLPIASGVIEGACRHLVQDRMGITGARWRISSAEAVLRLRALRSSGDFKEYWRFHEAREQERNHSSNYAEGHIPELDVPLPPPRPGA